MTSQYHYKHDSKAKDVVALVNITWQHQRKCEMPQLIKTKINFTYVYPAVLLPMHVVKLHDILEYPK